MRFFFKRERLLLIIVDCYKYYCNIEIEIEIENFNQIFDTYFCSIYFLNFKFCSKFCILFLLF